jgi:transposase-like protein
LIKKTYPAELKLKAVSMKLAGQSSREIAKELGITNASQIRIWMMWHRNGDTHRFHKSAKRQYNNKAGENELSEVERLNARIQQLEMHIDLLGKLNGILRKSQKANS